MCACLNMFKQTGNILCIDFHIFMYNFENLKPSLFLKLVMPKYSFRKHPAFILKHVKC